MAIDFLPCPFCGTPNPEVWEYRNLWRAKCVNGCGVSIEDYFDRDGVKRAWNRRPQQENLTKLDRLPTETEFVVEIADETNRILLPEQNQRLNLREVEAVIIALYNGGYFVPPLWRNNSNPPNKPPAAPTGLLGGLEVGD